MPTLTSQHIQCIFAILNADADYAVLRNYEGLPDSNDSRDIDIIITPKSYETVKRRIVEAIDNDGWKIVNYLHSDRLITFVCGKIVDDKEEGLHTELVQWDFFFDTSVFGIQLMGAEEFLQHKAYNGFLYYVGIECQFLDKYLYNRAVGAAYPAKYHATREAAEHAPIVTTKLANIFGCNSVAQCDKTSKATLLRRAFWQGICHRPIAAVWAILDFLWTFIANYINARTGFSIGFTGPDGVGKTTIIEKLIESMSPVFAKAHIYYHFRPGLFRNIGDVAQSAGLKKDVDRNYEAPHRGQKTGKINSLLRLSYYATDYIFGYFIKVKPTTRITRLAIFDRYYTDVVCDSRRSRIFLNYKFLYLFGKFFIPSLDYNILLTADVKTILARKTELDAENINLINEKIDFLCNHKDYIKVVNDKSPDDVVTTILNIIFNCQHHKNLHRLGIKKTNR